MRKIYSFLFLVVGISILWTACKKDKDDPIIPNNNALVLYENVVYVDSTIFDLTSTEGREAFMEHRQTERDEHREQRESRREQIANLSEDERTQLREEIEGLSKEERRQLLSERFGG